MRSLDPPDEADGLASVPNSSQQPDFFSEVHSLISILHCNIRSIKKHLGELQHRLDTLKPTLLALNETWLDDSTEQLSIPGYILISRRDRSKTSNCGGIALYARASDNFVVKLADSESAELTWAVIHSNYGPILFGVWYRQKDDRNSIQTFEREWLAHSTNTIGTVVVGDLNIHHRKWLINSNADTVDGEL